MIYILGVLSLFQILFLPGAILIRLFKLRRGIIQSIGFIFGLSLIFNFLWVFFLTLLKVNYPIAHYVLFGVEVILFVWIYKETLLSRSEDILGDLNERINEGINSLLLFFQFDERESSFSRIIKSLVNVVFIAWAVSSLLWVCKLLWANFGTAFNLWDAVVSWNNWATQWFSNIVPTPRDYAQLIPANFSITYSFLGSTDIQIFAKGFIPLFTIFTWLLMWDLAIEYKKPGMFIGIVILRYMTKKFLYEYIGEGYVDIPLLFFTFLTVYTLLKANNVKGESNKTSYLYLGAVFAAGTALTKQNGLLVFALYPFLAFLITAPDEKYSAIKDKVKILIKPMVLGLAVLLPWYLLNEYRIIIGENQILVDYLVSAERHQGRSYLERAVRAFRELDIYAYLFPFVLATLPLIPRKFRQVAYITIFPYTIIWTFLFSIFVRNLAMVFPFLALTAGLGAEGLLDLILRFAEKIRLHRVKLYFPVILLVAVIFGFSLYFSDEKITAMQYESQKDALWTGINQKLYAYFDDIGEYGTIMTHYPLKYLPVLQDYFLHQQFASYQAFYDKFVAHPETKYLLVWGAYADDEVLDRIEQLHDMGAIEFIFEGDGMEFYKVIDRGAIINSPPD
jgi:hypothetical protein